MTATWLHESDFRKDVMSAPNSNGTRDYGICQLNSRYHLDFIRSEEFKDPYKQLDYCISVYRDAKAKGRALGAVWYGWANKYKHINKINCK